MSKNMKRAVVGVGGGIYVCAEQPVVMLVSVEPIQTTVLL
jgi:hypothetical protein